MAKKLTIFLAIIIFSILVSRAFLGPIWRDDAFFASVAKNLLGNRGYSAIFFKELIPYYFGISSGPTIILPTTFLISIFENQYWVPGVSNILLTWSIGIAISYYIKLAVGSSKGWLFSLNFLILGFLGTTRLTSQNYGIETQEPFAMWHQLLGEIPAGLLIILGLFIIFSENLNYKNLIFGGSILGMAILTKTVAGCAVGTITLFLVGHILNIKTLKRIKRIKLITIFILFTLIPYFSFEFCKYLYLGDAQYIANLEKNYIFINSLAVHAPNLFSFSDKLMILNTVYLLPFLMILYCALYLKINNLTTNKYDLNTKLLGNILCFCAVCHLFWWTTFSIGIHRHLILGIIYLTACLALLLSHFLDNRPSLFNPILILFLLMISGRIIQLARYTSPSIFPINNRLIEQLQVKTLLDDLKFKGHNLVSCGSNFELEYLMKSSLNFIDCHSMDLSVESFILVNYFLDEDEIIYNPPSGAYVEERIPQKLLEKCSLTLFKSENYSVLSCSP